MAGSIDLCDIKIIKPQALVHKFNFIRQMLPYGFICLLFYGNEVFPMQLN